MITVSVCMIVKNEEAVLKRCLDSLKGVYDELIIVDTGSTDSTKKIASLYTDRIFDFKWVNDFSKARNFAMEKATCDYIYTADADEVLDEENRQKFIDLKKVMLPEVEIVEMRYVNQLENGTVYNFDSEYRAKMYKRLRNFTFIEPVHEMVRLDPVVFESDIDIIHMPANLHSDRDLQIFERVFEKEGTMSDRLTRMYARELMVSGAEENFIKAVPFFESIYNKGEAKEDILRISYIILAEAALVSKDYKALLKYALKDVASEGSSEVCSILGAFFETEGDLTEAAMWYYNARYETVPELNIRYSRDIPLEGLIRVYTAMGDLQTAASYEKEKNNS